MTNNTVEKRVEEMMKQKENERKLSRFGGDILIKMPLALYFYNLLFFFFMKNDDCGL